ncbi:type II secretion system protein GspJ [Anaeromyxobacter diazotrophicus]|uniref:Type II secretion system protein J n=1 Tax=Anaeromyxobacter diazotrophicus TaxID=2590199 RepID=A0A7I9VH75_9BACT|nr:type II secretion system protein GspJ [Anaeromyxobacter diazotrophicus]GEJ55599.1 type II secretory pathway [Anaeromyxobacter diazotrophicus]
MSRRGFTLIEVMIAVAITAVIGVMIMGAFQRTYATKELTEAQEERFGSARVTLTRLARELSEAFLSDHYDLTRFPRERPTLFRGKDGGAQDDLLFATMSHERLSRDVKESDQAVVEYTVEPDPDRQGESALFRREKARLDEEPDRGGEKAVVCEHVSTFDVQYWDWKKQEWAREWLSNGLEHTNILPTRVKIRLGVKGTDGKEQLFETQARIAMIRPLGF